MIVEDGEITPYHGRPKRSSNVAPELRDFIAWDGEGINLDGPNRPQSYVLFGCSTGDYISSDKHLHTFEILEFIISIGERFPTAFHVGFAFGYDSNMIVRSLSSKTLEKLHKDGRLTLRNGDTRYHLNYLPGKWFSVTRFHSRYSKTNTHAKTTVRIYDMFSFFAKSFIKAYEELVGPVPQVVSEGKANRNDFSEFSLDYIHKYWAAEIQMLRELAEALRRTLYGANLRITQWHGPGALASFVMRREGIKEHMAVTPKPVREAAKYGYAGGRFEIFRLGRTVGPIYSLDINSAYPFAITKLPSLSIGNWKHVVSPSRIARFGIYRVRLIPQRGDSVTERAPGPLFHRDKLGSISFPWIVEGWYWSPEVMNLRKIPDRYEIVEGWEFIGDKSYPFAWIKEMYETRREWKAKGLSSQLALKLCMNSIYGKLAQRVGWNEEKRLPPTWHQLEWAGYVTSFTRAMLWDLMSQIPREHIVAVETDGLYTTMSPGKLGISNSKELGGWEVKEYDEILYVQSGLAWLRKGDDWICKRRGLDARTFSLDDCRNYLRQLAPNTTWLPYVGQATRFIGLGAALASKAPMKVRHCVWQTMEREIRPGHGGKRVHIYLQCEACRNGLTAYEGAHDLSIRSLAYLDPMSHPHDIPWDGDGEPGWRDIIELEKRGYVQPEESTNS